MIKRGLWVLAVFILAGVICTPAMADHSLMPRAVWPFNGMIDLKSAHMVLTLAPEGRGKSGEVVLEVSRPASGRYDLKADIRHVATALGDVAAVLSGRFECIGADPLHRELVGEISTRYTLLNYKPVRDVHVKFTVRDRRLSVDPLWFGALSGRGQIELTGAHDMDIALELLSADLDEMWELLRGHGLKTPPISGIMTGSLTLDGPWAKPVLNGHVMAYNGRLKNLSYEAIDLRFEGTYPLISFQDGKVIAADGPSFKVGGSVDLSDLGRLGTQVRQLKKEFIVADDGGRTRSFRLNTADGHTTRLKSFMSGDADGRSQGDPVIGLEKQIGF